MKRTHLLLAAGFMMATYSSFAFAQTATGSGKASSGFSVSAPAGTHSSSPHATSGATGTSNPNNGTPMNEPAAGLNTTPSGAATTSGNAIGGTNAAPSGNVTTTVGGTNGSGANGLRANGQASGK